MSGVGVIGSTYVVAQRLAKFQEEHGRTVYVFRPVTERHFEFAGVAGSIEDAPADPDHAGGYGTVVLRFGEESVRLPVPIPPREGVTELPGVYPYEDWLRVLRFAPITGRTADEFELAIDSGELEERVVVVTRRQRPGAEGESWGRVWKKDWYFDLYELTRAGHIVHERFAYPQSRPYDEGEPELVGGVPQLAPDMWQYDASLMVMPEGAQPKIRAADSALRATGWSFGAAVVSVFGVVVGAALGLAPRGRGQPR